MASKGRAPGALFCDTNVLVRLLTDDPPTQARAAERALDIAGSRGLAIILTDVVFAELAYVLTEVYELTAADAARRMHAILDLQGVTVADGPVLRDALAIWGSQPLDFADAYLAALARATRESGILSFDRDFDRIGEIRRIDPVDLTS